jgi:hypothetical protein
VTLASPRPVRDLGIRLAISPVLGVLIPALAGLVTPSRHSAAGLAVTYAYFAACAFVIWTSNRWLYLRLPRREDWLERPGRRIAVLLGSIFLLTIPLSWLTLATWMRITGDSGLRPYALPMTILGIVTVVILITHVYETAFLLAEWDSARLRAALLEQARLRAELTALSREVDPHFLFNSLHALAYLVERGSSDSLPFIEALGDSYRYLLSARERPLVALDDELASLRRQFFVTGMRYGGMVRVAIDDLPPDVARTLQIPPVALTELLMNAVKHNVASTEVPLLVRVRLEGDTLVVSNPRRPRAAHTTTSTGLGLINLADRHRLATGLTVTWGIEEGEFRVRLPLAAASPRL